LRKPANKARKRIATDISGHELSQRAGTSAGLPPWEERNRAANRHDR
jgi:hypothetical protein